MSEDNNSADISVDTEGAGEKKKVTWGGSSREPHKVINRGRFKPWEDEIIKQLWITNADPVIAKELGRGVESVMLRRKKLGLHKPHGRPNQDCRKEIILAKPTEYNLSKLSKDDRLAFYKTKFDHNPRYKWLTKTLLPDELEYYRQKYIETIESLDSITMQEEDLLHNMLMKEILIFRMQTQMKEQIQEYFDSDEEDRPPINLTLYKDLEAAEKQYVQYQEKLRLTREQRLKTDKEEKITIAALVRSFLDAQNKDRAGQMAGQMDFFTTKCKNDMLKMQLLLGADRVD